jgi:predicted site-specific integrase-resolvase
MLLTVQETMKRLGISRAAVYAAMEAGKLKYVERYGKRLLYEKSVNDYKPRPYAGRRSPLARSFPLEKE